LIRIIDCGSQLTQNIARRISENEVYPDVVPHSTPLEKILEGSPEGLIISGGQFSVNDPEAPFYTQELLELKIPVLGICYGMQSMAYLLGGKVASGREYGKTRITVQSPVGIFKDLPQNEFVVWMSHGDAVDTPPPGFEVTARSENGYPAAMQKGNLFAVQFHPEVDHTEYGRQILKNFLELCGAKKDWNKNDFIENSIAEIRRRVGDNKVVGGLSGGVDSSAASVLLARALGENYLPIFVNNGLLRKNEAEWVIQNLTPFLNNLIYVDASEQFLKKLAGVSNPDEKRKIIGHEFVEVFQQTASGFEGVEYLLQGTLYPDVIESLPVYGKSSKIKRHHNVGGLPAKLGLKLIEPFRNLFKDEVREIGEKLGLPKEIVWRHPFPGPGLAVRIIGEVNPAALDLLREADSRFIEELRIRDLYYQIKQAFAVLTNTSSVGVMGDEGNYQFVVGLRAVTTNDFMTADWYDFKKDDLTAIANRIINEVPGVNRVVYDITQKPPGTIEWE